VGGRDAASIARVGASSGYRRIDVPDGPAQDRTSTRDIRRVDRPGYRHSTELRMRRLGRSSPRGPIRPAGGVNGKILHIISILFSFVYSRAASLRTLESQSTEWCFPDVRARTMLPHSSRNWNALHLKFGVAARRGFPPRRFSSRSSSRQASSRTWICAAS
jgi:hypothetical protein